MVGTQRERPAMGSPAKTIACRSRAKKKAAPRSRICDAAPKSGPIRGFRPLGWKMTQPERCCNGQLMGAPVTRPDPMASDDRYFSLLALAAAWASDAGIPPAMVLRNLCDWVIRGAFPAEALVTATGDKIDPFDIFMSRKALTAELGGGVWVDEVETRSPRWGASLLETVLVSERAIRAFCQYTDTSLPSLLASGLDRLRGAMFAKHRAPPVCPDAEEYAARYQARLSAEGRIGYFRSMLARLREGRIRRALRDRVDEATSFEIDRCEWESARDNIQREIHRCGDVHLQYKFEVLDRQLADIIARHQHRHSMATEAAERSTAADRTAGTVSKQRVKDWYSRWVADNEARGVIPPRDEDWEAAKAELGDGVPRDLVRSLRREIAPASWQQRGRRKSTGKAQP
jgi:hypothetical protein